MLRKTKAHRLMEMKFPDFLKDVEELQNSINDKEKVFIDKFRLFKILFTGVHVRLVPQKIAGRMHVSVFFDIPYDVERELFIFLGKEQEFYNKGGDQE